MTAAHFIDYLNPLTYMSHAQYMSLWRALFEALLQGFWAKLFASSALFLAFFIGVYRQRIVAGVLLFFVSIAIAYGGCILKFVLGL
ncbi:MAG: hypothetical protein A4E63_03111 [Syntrophorhabdus sp. PtaU1.Bin050]|jgi:hypothetical protein|nr:MAG: hypothetical protein A4E63_03111 [Syntrophorhabdus sp. PtaU1.Bin050]